MFTPTRPKIDMNNHPTVDDGRSHFHSSGFANAANGGRVGAASTLTFAERRAADQRRAVIGGYQKSNLGNAYGELRARPVATPVSDRPIPVAPPRK